MGVIEVLRDDLALQKKRLADMRTWKSADVLVLAQTDNIEKLEKQIAEMEIAEKSDGMPTFGMEALPESINPDVSTILTGE